MSKQLESSIVRIWTTKGYIAGVGFLVTERHVLTCAHVVAQALGLSLETKESPDSEVQLDFPLVAAGEMYQAQVTLWQGLDSNAETPSERGDIALLSLTGKPASAQVVPLVKGSDHWDLRVRMFGFPSRKNMGTWAEGVVRSRDTSGWMQVWDQGKDAYQVEQGFSGGPVFCGGLEAVIGMVSAVEKHSQKKVFYFIPVELLNMAWPSLPIRPALFNVPTLTKQFVQRPTEFEALIERLLAGGADNRTVAITTALQGGGGFGKTTLAQAICHDERIKQAFPDGILWLTVGQTPNLAELLSNQIKLFTPNETYADISAAAARLRTLLTGRRVLVVLDDVWQEYHARPFVQDSPTCAHLITTRQQEIAHRLQAQTVDVNEMQTSQAVELLIKWLSGTKVAEKLATDKELLNSLQQLAEYLGEWPLLLELVAAQLRDFVQRRRKSLPQAIQDVKERLKRRGFTAFDRKREQERNRAISISLGVSLDELDLLSEDALGDKDIWRQRYLELAIFPEDVDIPFATIFKLWEGTASFDELDSEDALYGMQNLSLFTRYDADKQTVRLHDVIGAYLAQQQAQKLPDLHSQFLAAYDLTNWADLPADEPYLWHHQAYHLHEAQRHDELRGLLLDFAWMNAKLQVTDTNALLADYDNLPNDEFISHIQRVLRQASHVLAEDHTQLAGQLWGRLTEEERAQLSSLPQSGAQRLLHLDRRLSSLPRYDPNAPPPSLELSRAEVAWLRPLHPSLRSSRALLRTFAGHNAMVTAITVSEDGRWALSSSWDKTVKVWDWTTGQERLTFTGHSDRVEGVTLAGRWALSCSYDGTVKVWDWATGQERLTFTGHTGSVTGVALSGRWALSCSYDGTVKVWDWATGQERLTFTGHTGSVEGVALSGRWVLSCSEDKTVKVWDWATGQERLTFTGHTNIVTGVALSGRWALSCSWDKTVKVWDWATGQERLTFTGHSSRVRAVALSGRWALSCSYDGTVCGIGPWAKNGSPSLAILVLY